MFIDQPYPPGGSSLSQHNNTDGSHRKASHIIKMLNAFMCNVNIFRFLVQVHNGTAKKTDLKADCHGLSNNGFSIGLNGIWTHVWVKSRPVFEVTKGLLANPVLVVDWWLCAPTTLLNDFTSHQKNFFLPLSRFFFLDLVKRILAIYIFFSSKKQNSTFSERV